MMIPPRPVLIATLLTLVSFCVNASEPMAYEMPRTEVVPLQDRKADRQYELYVRLPEDYSDDADTPYPVIYSTDAAWHMEMLAGSTEYLMPNAIVVGISWQTDLEGDRPHTSRFRDYTLLPSMNAQVQAKYQPGQAEQHLAFIRDGVIPHIESRYRADPSLRAYFGYSLGGAFGSYALLSGLGDFSHYILGSPAFNERSMTFLEEFGAKTLTKGLTAEADVFVSIGELETSELDRAQRFTRLLERRTDAGINFTGLEVIDNSDHGTAFPETVIRSVRWLSQRAAQ